MRAILLTFAAIALFSIASSARSQELDDFVPHRFAVVVKEDGIPWFERMRQGVDAFAIATGHEAFLVGPSAATPEAQVAIIEEMLADQVDALCIVPVSPAACEEILGRAMRAGIKVIAHDAAGLKNCDIVLEPFPNARAAGADELTGGYQDWEGGGGAYDPGALGYAMLAAAEKLARGEPVGAGTDLGIDGYRFLHADPMNPKVLYGNASKPINAAPPY